MNDVHNLKDFLALPTFQDGVLSGHDNQIFLYAKNHYNTTGDMIQDLKILISSICNMDVDHISMENLYHIVHGVWWNWVEENEKFRFTRDLFKGGLRFDDEIKIKEVINSMLSQISLIQMVYENDKELRFGKEFGVDFLLSK